MFLKQASFSIPYPSEMFPLDASASVIHVKDKCAPYLGLWVNSLVGFSILSSFSISKIDLFLILPNAPHTRVRADCREFKLRLRTSHRFIFLELSLSDLDSMSLSLPLCLNNISTQSRNEDSCKQVNIAEAATGQRVSVILPKYSESSFFFYYHL